MKFFRLKKIDRLLLKEYIPPFFVAFSIALFVLMMQFLWLWIDDIAGKGIGIFVLVEMLYYLGLSLIPMALPISILLASVIVYGNFSEKYELASLKTAGVPLMRVMRSSMAFAALIALSSYLCSNYIIPYANLKFRSRLYDIKKQKPALYLESGVFNDDFQGYSIRIGRKHSDNRRIEDIMIDDDASNNRNYFNIIRAKKGEMFVTGDDRYFIMKLTNGDQYQKMEKRSVKDTYPFIRTKFREWTKVFDLGEFDLKRTDEDLFKSYHAMLTTKQLQIAIDSINAEIARDVKEVNEDTRRKMFYIHDENPAKIPEEEISPVENPEDRGLVPEKFDKSQALREVLVDQPFLDSLKPNQSIVFSFAPENQVDFLDKARSITRSSKNKVYEFMRKSEVTAKKKQRHTYHLHSKYGFALVCFIFLFIGAPMGAIVRKGGFGYPFLISIFFFMLFIILTKLFEKLSKSYSIDPISAAWLPCAILFPIGVFLTYKAMNDSKILQIDRFVTFITKLFNKKRRGEVVDRA